MYRHEAALVAPARRGRSSRREELADTRRARRFIFWDASPAAAGVSVDHGARRADPREHGRKAARSKRDRPGGQASRTTQLSHVRAVAGGALEYPIEPNSAATPRNKPIFRMLIVCRRPL